MKCDKKDLLLYAVTDRSWLNGKTLYGQVEQALKGGVSFVQLREKNLNTEAFLQEAIQIQSLCRTYGVPFVINDNIDIALAMNADGVHVGQKDMEVSKVRAKLGPDKLIGVSAQTVEQAVKAEKEADRLEKEERKAEEKVAEAEKKAAEKAEKEIARAEKKERKAEEKAAEAEKKTAEKAEKETVRAEKKERKAEEKVAEAEKKAAEKAEKKEHKAEEKATKKQKSTEEEDNG